jgi:Uma2 family endonuclease
MTLMDVAPPESQVNWPIPPEDGYFAEDLDTIPDLPPHTQLIDGSLVFVSPQVLFHKRAITRLVQQLSAAAPPEFAVQWEMTVTLGSKQRLEPDVMVTWAAAEVSDDQSDFKPEDVLLVVEVVSNESRLRDRERKPALYAGAGIRRFWRVENLDGRPTLYMYELDPATRSYVGTGIVRDPVSVDEPFPVEIDLTGINVPKTCGRKG